MQGASVRVCATCALHPPPMLPSLLPAYSPPHPSPPAHSAWGSWHCYFHRLTSPACQAAAQAALTRGGGPQAGGLGSTEGDAGGAEGSEGGEGVVGACRPVAEVGSAVASEARVVCATTHVRASAAVPCRDGDAGAEPSGTHPAEAAAARSTLFSFSHPSVLRASPSTNHSSSHRFSSHHSSSHHSSSHRSSQGAVVAGTSAALHAALAFALPLPPAQPPPPPRLRHARGRHMATHHAEAQGILSSLLLPPLAARHPIAARALQQEGRELAALNLSTPHSVEAQVWPGLGFQGCVARGRGNVMATPGNPLADYFGAGREAYVLRPIVAMDTGRRRGVERAPVQHSKEDEQDKEEGEDEEVGRSGQEGELEERGRREQMAVVASVFHAYSLRQHDPDLHHVWLTASPSQGHVVRESAGPCGARGCSAMWCERVQGHVVRESAGPCGARECRAMWAMWCERVQGHVVREGAGPCGARGCRAMWCERVQGHVATQTHLAAFDDWTFLNSRHDSYGQSAAASMAGVVGSHLASVLIAAESDYFVGSLASQHTRLILALRATNGRLAAPAVLLK
ncbi:unnamed protein product [Closterium sp. Naga37s-1]|nr:unnamed protein product [Closterium sp. Naga37s-1]